MDSAGNVYLTENPVGESRVLKLAPGESTPAALPVTGLREPFGVAVDKTGNLYVVDRDHNQVLKLPAGSSTQAVLPFTDLNWPIGVAVDGSGNIYVADMKNRGC